MPGNPENKKSEVGRFAFEPTNLAFGPIGQKELVKAAIIVEIQMIVAVLSYLQQDIPWTKRVGKIAFKY